MCVRGCPGGLQIESLAQHKSQYSNYTALKDGLYELGQYVAAQVGDSTVKYAEGFLPILELP